MIDKKYLIVAVLATFCLTATLFMIVPTKSQSSNYDPWTDVNGDGTIDMADISMAIDGFMTSGDTTKNVNVTNWPTEPQPTTIIVCKNYTITYIVGKNYYYLPTVADLEGYDYVSVFVTWRSIYNSTLYCSFRCMNIGLGVRYPFASIQLRVQPGETWPTNGSTGNVVQGPEANFCVYLVTGEVEVTIILYCYN